MYPSRNASSSSLPEQLAHSNGYLLAFSLYSVRSRSYVERTSTWDDFPNGRFGSRDIPAFGEFEYGRAAIKDSQKKEGPLSVEINSHSHVQMMPEEPSLVQTEGENPCSNLGCNSMTCAWASGGVIRRVEAKKACSNALSLGSSAGKVIPADSSATAMSSALQSAPSASALQSAPAADATATVAAKSVLGDVKISTLKECMNAVRSKTDACSGHFQMHKDTLECSCVPAGAECAQTEDENICTYKVREQ